MGKTGQSAQFGYAEESTFGTRVTPDRFHEFTQESVQIALERMESEGLRAGKRVQRHWIPNKKGAGGQITFEVANKGFGRLLKHLLGSIATTTPGGGTLTRDHTATLGDLDGKSLTLQIGRPGLDNVVHPFDYVGAKIAEFELSNEIDGFLMLALTFDAQDEKTDQTLATASYATGLTPLSWQGGTITLDGNPIDVGNFSLSGSNQLKTDRYYIRGNVLKKEQIEDTAPRGYQGSMAADFEDMTLYNRFIAGTEGSLVGLWEGDLIEGVLKYGVQVTLPRVRFDGETPTVGGPDVLSQPIGYKVLQPTDGSSAVSIRYRTSDVTP